MYRVARTVQLSEDAYATLASLKRKGESFSDVVRRLVRSRKRPEALFDLVGPTEGFDLAALRRRSRQRDLEALAARGLDRTKGSPTSRRRKKG